MSSILIVEDEILLAKELANSLIKLGYEITGKVSSGEDCLNLINEKQPDLILMDINLAGEIGGIETAQRIRAGHDIPIIYLTGYAEEDVLERAKRTEPYGYLGKPVSFLELRSTIETAIYKHQADRRVRLSESRYQTLLETIAEGVILQDNRYVIHSYNSSAERILGVSLDQVVGRSSFDITWNTIKEDGSPYPVQEHPSTITLQTGKSFKEARMGVVHEDGVIWISVNTRPMFNENESLPSMVVISFSDITEQIGEALQMNGGPFDTQLIDKQGNLRDFSIKNKTVVVAGKEVLLGVLSDITRSKEIERRFKQIEHDLRKERDRAQLYLDTADVIIIALDNHGRIERVNKKASETLGYPEVEIIGQNWFEMFTPEDCRAEVFGVFSDIIKGRLDPVRNYENPILTKTGEQRLIAWRNNFLSDESGAITGIISSGEDITEKRAAEMALRASEERYRTFYNKTPAMLHSIDSEGRIVAVSERWIEVFGYDLDEVIGRLSVEFLTEESRRMAEEVILPEFFQKGFCKDVPYDFVKKTGEIVNVLLSATAEYDSERRFVKSLAVLDDVTQRKKTEEALKESEAKFRRLFETSPDAHVLYGYCGYLDCNESTLRILGFSSREDLMFAQPEDISPEYQPDGLRSAEKARSMVETAFKQGTHRFDWVCKRKDGNLIYLDILCNSFSLQGKPIIHAVWRDMTERKIAEDRIKDSLREKEVLLREIHHRVKNNLASIISLVTLQSQYVSDDSVTRELNKVSERIRSMVVAHELLYQSENLASINVEHYLKNVAGHLIDQVAVLGKALSIQVNIEELSFSIDTAIPLGFIVTELVTNCVKHAFPGGKAGKICISLRALDNGDYELIVWDDGVGIPQGIGANNLKSFGLELVVIFVDQLNGRMDITRRVGTEVRIEFKEAGK